MKFVNNALVSSTNRERSFLLERKYKITYSGGAELENLYTVHSSNPQGQNYRLHVLSFEAQDSIFKAFQQNPSGRTIIQVHTKERNMNVKVNDK